MRISVVLVGVSLLMAASACTSSDYIQVGDNTYPPRPDDWAIDVYVGVDAPVVVQKSITHAKPATTVPENAALIGRVDAQGTSWNSWKGVIDEAKEKARTLGGDALVIGRWGQHLEGFGSYGEAYHGKNIAVSVLRYADTADGMKK